MINFDNLRNPDLLNETILEIQSEYKTLNDKIAELEQSNTTLRDTNHRLFLRVDANHQEQTVEPDKSRKDYMNDIMSSLGKKGDK